MHSSKYEVSDHLPLVHFVIQRHFLPLLGHHEYDDLYQVGSIGLMLACEKYDEKHGVKFSTFATRYIWGRIMLYHRDNQWIKIPRVTSKERVKLDGTETPEEVSKRYGISLDAAKNAIARYLIKKISLDTPLNLDEGEVTLGEVIPVSQDYSRAEVMDFLSRLDPKWRSTALLLMDGLTQMEVGQRLGISQVQVSRIRRQIGKKYADYAKRSV